MTAEKAKAIDPQQNRPSELSERWRFALMIIGVILVPLGIIGIILPVLPGVPILILAAACFARSSPRLERWLVSHPQFGPGIIAWRERGAIPTRAKILAIGMMGVSTSFVILSTAPVAIKGVVTPIICAAALFVGTRPNA